ncbi:MAG: phosphoribosylamine--glycine ligase [Sphingomonadales bacterium CG12_big_fil_rev_8_21_14_0_65_65_10]|uniref:phosphoribosylamine--glycine ligase n=1 Tax=Blastomonas marina TaxID=1867408 RepID=UPI000CCB7415|nr:phosphoribosylamine--glycine ligase [Blastomonas marina]PIW53975.1 MAG: phosphoribosylamine--glycine ligase [Sphingomonadales bacterium CG12_big_fil_rev_8_21_14_0_65_65_10]WPZ03553.1 phosphoribosylamine--glycine ligase [Blastomonas marina]
MNILLLGSGGREHALAWKLMQSPRCDNLQAAPGNPGMEDDGAQSVALDVGDHAAVIAHCRDNDIALVVIGPEAPLVDGLADSLREAGIPVFGPSAEAAQLEGSKAFTKRLCGEADIPTAGYAHTTSLDEARTALDRFEPPYVLKADGLAAGKGVVIAANRAEADSALADMFGGRFGEAGAEVVIEEFLTGEEASFFALADGETVRAFGTAQDHKRVGDGDTGPNTGGMGAYSPASILTLDLQREVMERIVEPTVATMKARGTPFSGVLYAGLMLTSEGPKLIEYNVRFGDPECQVLMARLDEDLVELMLACANGTLSEVDEIAMKKSAALTVVMAAPGYPGTPEKGGTICKVGAAEQTGAKIFHAGTKRNEDGQLVANGGRVLNVTALADSVTTARNLAYEAIMSLDFDTGFCRTDIGWRELERERG